MRVRELVWMLVIMLVLCQVGLYAGEEKGSLVIVGGGLSLNNSTVYNRILDLGGPGATVGILPTASGVPEKSGPGYVGDFTRYGGPDRAEVIEITQDTPELAKKPEMAEKIRKHKILFFTGGDQSRITKVFRPDGEDTLCYKATRDVLNNGGVIAGSSAGAAMMSDPMLRWGRSDEALIKGASEVDGEGVGVGVGMGFFPYGLTGQHFMRRGRLGRMIAALEHANRRFGFGLDNNSAIAVDLESGRIETIGPRALLMVDMKHAKKDGLKRENIRLNLLGGGDLIDGETGKVFPAPGKIPFFHENHGLEKIPTVEKAWDKDVIPNVIEKMAVNPAKKAMAYSDKFELHFTEDENTRYWATPDKDVMSISALSVRLDIIPKAGVKPVEGEEKTSEKEEEEPETTQ